MAALILWESGRDLLWFKVYGRPRPPTVPFHGDIVEAWKLMTRALLNYDALKTMMDHAVTGGGPSDHTENLKVSSTTPSPTIINLSPAPTIFGKRIPIPRPCPDRRDGETAHMAQHRCPPT
jgi:hypothetical protein